MYSDLRLSVSYSASKSKDLEGVGEKAGFSLVFLVTFYFPAAARRGLIAVCRRIKKEQETGKKGTELGLGKRSGTEGAAPAKREASQAF